MAISFRSFVNPPRHLVSINPNVSKVEDAPDLSRETSKSTLTDSDRSNLLPRLGCRNPKLQYSNYKQYEKYKSLSQVLS